MAKDRITPEQLNQMDLPDLMSYALPVIAVLMLLEFYLIVKRDKERYNKKDFLASLGIGTGNVLISALFKVASFTLVLFFYNMVPWQVPHTWWGYLICFTVLDLCRYWAHRISHEQRFWWATHVTHHSSEYLNWSTNMRVSWTQHIKLVFFIPVPLMGCDPIMFLICHQISVIYQFWVHTEIIPKLPRPIEWFFVTPSHHRVHHAKNPKYIDKNYGSTFIIWDRLFNTFEEEVEKPVYGITRKIDSFNPVYLNFHEWMDIFRDFKTAKTWKEKYEAVFGRPR
jgi:sterol desaturase/sphingolipid hydroxylase (fatty acid hydroxylase superfamily)